MDSERKKKKKKKSKKKRKEEGDREKGRNQEMEMKKREVKKEREGNFGSEGIKCLFLSGDGTKGPRGPTLVQCSGNIVIVLFFP